MVNHGDVLTEILHEVELVAGEQHGAAGAAHEAAHGARVCHARLESDPRCVRALTEWRKKMRVHSAGL